MVIPYFDFLINTCVIFSTLFTTNKIGNGEVLVSFANLW